MDRSSGKRGTGYHSAAKKGHGGSLRDGMTEDGDRNAQFCNRIGCSGRVKYAQDTKMRTHFHSSDENETSRKLSRSTSMMTSAKRPALDSKRKLPSQSRFDRSYSSLSDKSEFLSSTSSVAGTQSESEKDSGNFNLTEGRNCKTPSSLNPRKNLKGGSKSQMAMALSPTPLSSRSSTLRSSSTSEGGRFVQRNLKLYSVSDSIPNCSSQEPESSENKMKKKRNSEAGSSVSDGGRKPRAASHSDTSFSPLTNRITISGSRGSGSASGEGGGGPSSFWTRRPMNASTRTRLSCRQNGRNNSSTGKTPPLCVSRIPDDERPIDLGGQSLFDASSSRSYNLSTNSRDSQSTRMPFSLVPMRSTPSTDQDFLHHYDMGGAAEVLLSLQRIEQDEELTHEQVLALEISLFFGGLNLYDRHQDMRLDIDSMSYEELLALGDSIGTVSTPLSEEDLSKCLSRSTYQDNVSTPHRSNNDGDDIKCCICQEEYAIGDEIGKLSECHHGYHNLCINEWLRLKNWCPICKASAAPSRPSSSF